MYVQLMLFFLVSMDRPVVFMSHFQGPGFRVQACITPSQMCDKYHHAVVNEEYIITERIPCLLQFPIKSSKNMDQ